LNPTETAASSARVVRGVVHGLLKGRWNGGDRLTEIEAVELFKVSRTPVREALIALRSMGIVELRRNCGAVFHPFGEKELGDLYAVRSLLEVEATRLAATRMDEERINQLLAAFEKLKREHLPDTDWKLDRELHSGIAQACGNARLASEIARYGDLVQTIREAVGSTVADIHTTTLSDHLEILQCLKKRNPEAAGEAMRRHLGQAAESAMATLARLGKSNKNRAHES